MLEQDEGFFSNIGIKVWLVAFLVGLLHVVPYWHAQSQTPPGWTFTGNLSEWPDEVQYRTWMRQAPAQGPITDNHFTSEPNHPYLPVVLYYALGKISSWIHVTPDFVYIYAGAVLAFLFAIVLYASARRFLNTEKAAWWVFLVLLFGGGLGGYIKFLEILLWQASSTRPVATFVNSTLEIARVFEDYRENYIVKVLFDTHFAFFWLLALIAVLSLYFTLRNFSLWRLAATCAIYAAVTFLHVYEGITLICITAAVCFLCWQRGLTVRPALFSLVASALSVGCVFLALNALQRSGGLPVPQWRSPNISLAVLFMAFPAAWIVLATSFAGYWRTAGLKECFLAGWALGCTALVLSGPFYPYAARATITMQIPLYIIAGSIYFSRHSSLTWKPAIVLVLLAASTPLWVLTEDWRLSRFRADAPAIFMNAQYESILEVLRHRAAGNDVLLAAEPDTRWIAPEYSGRHYCAHFFLTVDYKNKAANVLRFLKETDPRAQAAFLQKHHIRFLYVGSADRPQHFRQIPGITELTALPVGSLFEFNPSGIDNYLAVHPVSCDPAAADTPAAQPAPPPKSHLASTLLPHPKP